MNTISLNISINQITLSINYSYQDIFENNVVVYGAGMLVKFVCK